MRLLVAVSATSIADILFAGKLVAVDCYHKESREAYGLYLVDSRKYPMGYPFFVSALASLVGAWLLDEKNPGNTPFAFLCGFLGIIYRLDKTIEEYHIQFCLLPDFSYRVIYD